MQISVSEICDLSWDWGLDSSLCKFKITLKLSIGMLSFTCSLFCISNNSNFVKLDGIERND